VRRVLLQHRHHRDAARADAQTPFLAALEVVVDDERATRRRPQLHLRQRLRVEGVCGGLCRQPRLPHLQLRCTHHCWVLRARPFQHQSGCRISCGSAAFLPSQLPRVL